MAPICCPSPACEIGRERGGISMKRFDLDRFLREARVPEPSKADREVFPNWVIERLQKEGKLQGPHSNWPLAAGIGFTAVCGLLVGFFLWHRVPAIADASVALRDGRVLFELEARYPNRLQAIIQDGSGLHTQLSSSADVAESDPIWIEIRD